MYIKFNNNPLDKLVGDCVIRAIAKATDDSWDVVHDQLCDLSYTMADMPSSNAVWGTYLENIGFQRGNPSDRCSMCYTVREFANHNREGIYVVGTGSHVVCIIDGNYYDTWDSGDEIPIVYFKRRKQ